MYLPNLRAAVSHFRAFSWQSNENHHSYKVVGESSSDSSTVWPDSKLGPFGPRDKRFPLPGTVGTTLVPSPNKPTDVQPREIIEPEALFETLPTEKQGRVLEQAMEEVEFLEETTEESSHLSPNADELLECVAYECPQIMRKDFADLFPWMDIMHGHFTIITVCQKTREDMTGWSLAVEEEREKLLGSFVQGATEICQELQKAGFWADFIDPSCGKPFLSTEYTNASLYETDERYKKLGFEIEDLGCCKVIRHHVWGTHSYVGCIFTNASTRHPLLEIMTKTK